MIEVLSPSTEFNDRGKKFQRCEQNGTRECWLVNTDSTYVEVYRREGDKFVRYGIFGRGETFTSPVLGGATITVDKLFV